MITCSLCGGKGWVDCGVNSAAVLAGEDDACPACKPDSSVPRLIHVGYWRSNRYADEAIYPWPIENQLKTDQEVHEALGILSVLENLKQATHVKFMGVSVCRLCGVDNGCGEVWFPIGNVVYCWPERLKHYIAAHRVALPKEIREISNFR